MHAIRQNRLHFVDPLIEPCQRKQNAAGVTATIIAANRRLVEVVVKLLPFEHGMVQKNSNSAFNSSIGTMTQQLYDAFREYEDEIMHVSRHAV